MGRYYFHIRNGDLFVEDEEGMECADLQEALAEAQTSAQDTAKVASLHAFTGLTAIEVEDEDGEMLANVAASRTCH